jgi:hypothetical protein
VKVRLTEITTTEAAWLRPNPNRLVTFDIEVNQGSEQSPFFHLFRSYSNTSGTMRMLDF